MLKRKKIVYRDTKVLKEENIIKEVSSEDLENEIIKLRSQLKLNEQNIEIIKDSLILAQNELSRLVSEKEGNQEEVITGFKLKTERIQDQMQPVKADGTPKMKVQILKIQDNIKYETGSKENLKVRGDSIRIRFDNCLLEVATFDLNSNTLEKAEITKKINELLVEIRKIEFNSPDLNTKISIKYSSYIGGKDHEFKKLTMASEDNRSKSFIVKEGELLETDFGNIIPTKSPSVSSRFDTCIEILSGLESKDFIAT